MQHCQIVEDLWPLYEEGLVQPKTRAWIEAHCATCASCATLHEQIQSIPVPAPDASPEQVMKHVTRKLKLYEWFMMTLAFMFAMNTTLFSEQAFQFILSYFLLGVVAYSFYNSWLFTALLAFVPTALASMYDTIRSYDSLTLWWTHAVMQSDSVVAAVTQLIAAALFAGALHTLFTFLGALFVWLLQKGFQKEDAT